MAFESVEVPEHIAFNSNVHGSLEMAAREVDESVHSHVFSGIGFAVLWGRIINANSFSPSFYHGIFNHDTEKIEGLMDVPAFVDFSETVREERDIEAKNFGIDFSDDSDCAVYPIPEEYHQDLRAVSVYFDRPVKKLLGAAIDLRRLVVAKQLSDEVYGYAYGFRCENHLAAMKLPSSD